MSNDLKHNASGCDDPTAYAAIKNVEKAGDVRFYKLIHTIFHVCELAGFEVEGRMCFRDKKTGKIYK